MKRALIIRHAAPETLAGNYRGVLLDQGFELEPLNVFESAPGYERFDAPDLADVSMILILGGPFSANDDLAALHQERAYLKEALAQDLPVFGVCLGAQMMSTALGGVVEPSGGYQIGLKKVSITAEGKADRVFSNVEIPLVPTLHGDTFSIPEGAMKLADAHMLRRDGTYRRINMAFRYGRSYAFQFEPQLTLDEFRVWDRELRGDYQFLGSHFDPEEEAAANLREFTAFAPHHERQMRRLLLAFLANAGLSVGT